MKKNVIINVLLASFISICLLLIIHTNAYSLIVNTHSLSELEEMKTTLKNNVEQIYAGISNSNNPDLEVEKLQEANKELSSINREIKRLKREQKKEKLRQQREEQLRQAQIERDEKERIRKEEEQKQEEEIRKQEEKKNFIKTVIKWLCILGFLYYIIFIKIPRVLREYRERGIPKKSNLPNPVARNVSEAINTTQTHVRPVYVASPNNSSQTRVIPQSQPLPRPISVPPVPPQATSTPVRPSSSTQNQSTTRNNSSQSGSTRNTRPRNETTTNNNGERRDNRFVSSDVDGRVPLDLL